MEPLPKRTSLVHETAATLKQWIRTGILRAELPGELQLKERLKVGRDTLRGALQILADEGWISAEGQGRQRRVRSEAAMPPLEPAPEKLPITFISPHIIEHRVTLLEMEDSRERLEEQGRALRFIAPQIFHLKKPERALDRLVRANPSAAWVLYLAGERMQRWFEQNQIPTLIYGSPFPGVTLPYVVSDWGAAAFHAALQLLRRGHRVLGIIEYEEPFPGILAINDGMNRALATAGDSARLHIFKDDRTPRSVAEAIESAMTLRDRPSALVLTRATQVLTCLSWFAAHGVRIPQDASVICLANDSWFADLYPPISFYEPDTRLMSRSIAERVMDLVQFGRAPRKSVKIPMHYVAGETVGPPGGKD
jgi:DNA-binding LacI/PurR family transcriptional regulator